MNRQNMMKTHNRYVWILFSTLALCMLVLWTIPGLQPADAHPFRQPPRSGIPGFSPPPLDSTGYPLFAPPPEFPLGKHGSFPPPRPGFVTYQLNNKTLYHPDTQIARIAFPLGAMSTIPVTEDLPDHNEHLWLENASISNSLHIMLRFPGAPQFKRLVPPPPYGGLLRAPVLTPEVLGAFSQEKQLLQDSTGTLHRKTAVQKPFAERPDSLTQQFSIPQDRLQQLHVLRL